MCCGAGDDPSLSLVATNTSNEVVTLLFLAVASWPCCMLLIFMGPKIIQLLSIFNSVV